MQYTHRKLQRSVTEMRKSCIRRPSASRGWPSAPRCTGVSFISGIMAWRRAHRKENTVGKSTIWAHFRCACATPGAQWAMAESTPPEALAESPSASLPEASAPYTLAVIMERARLADRWGTEQWEAKGVVHDTAPDEASG